jgi:hypothetical protein
MQWSEHSISLKKKWKAGEDEEKMEEMLFGMCAASATSIIDLQAEHSISLHFETH